MKIFYIEKIFLKILMAEDVIAWR